MKFQAVDGTVWSALNVDCVEKIILWAEKKSPMNLCGLCVERKLTGFSSTNLETLEEKSILILCAYPVTDYGRKPNIALNATFALDVKRLEIGVKIYLIKTLRLNMPIAGFVQDNIMPSVSVKFHDLSVKHVNKELNQNVLLSPEM